MSIHSYIYTHKKSFLNNPESNHSTENFRGQVYEASFYEWLKDNVEYLNMKLVAKPPYIKRASGNYGFLSSNDGSCCYYSRGVPLFEFDAICYSDKSIVFYECFISKWDKVKKSHKEACKRKIAFLKKIFPNHTIKCIVVSNNKENLDIFNGLDGVGTKIHPEPEINLKALAMENNPRNLALTPNMIKPHLLSQVAKKFDYLSLQLKISEGFNKNKNIKDTTQQIISFGEVVKRLHLGLLEGKSLKEDLNCKETEKVVLSLDFNDIKKPNLRYYIYENGVSELRPNKKPKILNRYKASRKELLLLKEEIKSISINDYKEIYSAL
ncbi:hypothetical protein [Pseudoalteromonas sp. T1lg22]|uniref:hypothetical protein n=1 Tax=Pseudoalteromonas sp. T1lg22 TaxID=2077096 RepID=UPI000CF63E37|nr:hypothetical protein [Pseudoalteromonas sp. T1lg22]